MNSWPIVAEGVGDQRHPRCIGEIPHAVQGGQAIDHIPAPQYAPEYIIRTGVNYRWRDRAKVSLLGTFVDDHFADDGNTVAFQVPAYMTWDLTAEVKVWKESISLMAGINNLFDEDYYARIVGNGIDPAYGRN